MAPGSRKNSATKAQASSSKAPLKQTTLFRSFSSKNAPNVVPTEPQVLPQDLDMTLAGDATSSPPADKSIMLSKPEYPVLDSSPVDPKTVVENSLIDLTEAIDVDAGEDIPKKESVPERRSPSITIIDDTATAILPQPTPGRDERSKKKSLKAKGSTRDEPIVIVSSPIKVSSTSQDINKPIHPFFMSKPKVDTPLAQVAHSRTSKLTAVAEFAPFPNKESQHVRGPQTSIPGYELPFSKRPFKKPENQVDVREGYGFLKRQETAQQEPPTEIWVHRISDPPEQRLATDIPEEHILNHPAISRLVNGSSENWPTSRRPWTEKWRPSCAQEVLGNEKSAIYLRNWLCALELQFEHNIDQNSMDVQQTNSLKGKSKQSSRGTKRSRVIRTVDKHRKKTRLDSDEEDDSWIAYSDESEVEVDYEELDEFGEVLSEVPASSQSSVTRVDPHFSNDSKEDDLGQLHNTILLSGPSGSGKTASVYACAEELGWDVFEVYPGVGRRNGSNVDNLIGEVGKNHLVLQKNTEVLKSFLSKKNEDNPSADNFQPAYSPRKKTSSKDTSEMENELEQPSNRIKPIRQSLVLLEEVDILFKEDMNFWTTVTRIIKDCKRPVICTCNDMSLVPISELPLQNIIQFVPCPVDVATSYLQALCLAEGYSIEREGTARVYSDPGDGFVTPRPDLRRVINSLQVKCSTTAFSEEVGAQSPATEVQQQTRSILKFGQRIEFLSYLDGNLMQNAVDYVVIDELSSYLPSDNDEIGHTILYDIHAKDRLEFGRHDRQSDIICSAVEVSCRLSDMNEDNDAARRCEDRKKESLERGKRVLREICPTAVWARGKGSLWLEYMPYVRQMVTAEDIEEEKERKTRKVGRATRNSARSGYVRTIVLTEEARRDVMFNIVDGA